MTMTRPMNEMMAGSGIKKKGEQIWASIQLRSLFISKFWLLVILLLGLGIVSLSIPIFEAQRGHTWLRAGRTIVPSFWILFVALFLHPLPEGYLKSRPISWLACQRSVLASRWALGFGVYACLAIVLHLLTGPLLEGRYTFTGTYESAKTLTEAGYQTDYSRSAEMLLASEDAAGWKAMQHNSGAEIRPSVKVYLPVSTYVAACLVAFLLYLLITTFFQGMSHELWTLLSFLFYLGWGWMRFSRLFGENTSDEPIDFSRALIQLVYAYPFLVVGGFLLLTCMIWLWKFKISHFFSNK